MIKIGQDVSKFIMEEAKNLGIAKPVVLLMDCGCMLNQETVEVDIKPGPEKGYALYTKVDEIPFFVSPKVRHLADKGRLAVSAYGTGKFRKLEFIPGE